VEMPQTRSDFLSCHSFQINHLQTLTLKQETCRASDLDLILIPCALPCELDFKRSTFRDAWLRPGPHVAPHMHRARARRNRLPDSSYTTEKGVYYIYGRPQRSGNPG
jgi:hypothetical protein